MTLIVRNEIYLTMVARVSVVFPTGSVGCDRTNSSVAELKLDSIGVGAARNRDIEFASSTSLQINFYFKPN